MVCPKCKQKLLKCTDTRHMDQYTRRRRECSICGFRITTYEIDQETFRAKKDRLIYRMITLALC